MMEFGINDTRFMAFVPQWMDERVISFCLENKITVSDFLNSAILNFLMENQKI